MSGRYATDWCSDSKGPEGGYDVGAMVGSRAIILFFFTIIELITTIYVINNIWFKRIQMNIGLKLCLTLYHISLFFRYLFNLLHDLNPTFTGGSWDNEFSCGRHFFSFLMPTIYYATFIFFWNLRLNIVFKDSIYRVSKQFNYLIYIWAGGFVLIIYILVSISLIIAFNLPPNKAFCLISVKVQDFVPYTSKSWTKNNNDDVDDFVLCRVNHVEDFTNSLLYVSVATVPILNIVIAVQYIRKMVNVLKMVDDDSNSPTSPRSPRSPTSVSGSRMNWNFEKSSSSNSIKSKQRVVIFRNTIIAFYSTSSTLLALLLFIIADDTLWVSLADLDAYTNGLLMIAVTQFGAWIYDYLCVKFCIKFICCGRLLQYASGTVVRMTTTTDASIQSSKLTLSSKVLSNVEIVKTSASDDE